ncbi:MAG: Flp family type IVb pilin [Oceanococcaceae bacterium]
MTSRIAKRQQRGATVIEYALIAALIAVVIFVTVGELGTGVDEKFGEARDAITGEGG